MLDPKLKKAIRMWLIILGVLMVVIGGIIAYFYIGLSGGISAIIRDNTKSPPASSLELQRGAAVAKITGAHDDVRRFGQITYFDQSSYDNCYRGVQSFTRNDVYTTRCEYRITQFYGFNSDFKQTMLAFEDYLKANGWTNSSPDFCVHCTMKGVIDNYYSSERFATTGKKRYVSDLPSPAGYSKDKLILSIEYTEREAEVSRWENEYSNGEQGLGNFLRPMRRKSSWISQLLGKITAANQYALSVAIEGRYFEN